MVFLVGKHSLAVNGLIFGNIAIIGVGGVDGYFLGNCATRRMRAGTTRPAQRSGTAGLHLRTPPNRSSVQLSNATPRNPGSMDPR